MNKKRPVFFLELYRSNKLLLLLVLAYLGFSGFSALTKMQLTPVYMWNMFAVPLPERKEFSFTEIRAGGRLLNDPGPWHYFDNMVAGHSLAHYRRCLSGEEIAPEFQTFGRLWAISGQPFPADRLWPDSAALQAYPGWLKRYLGSRMDQVPDTLQLIDYTVRYDAAGYVHPLSVKTTLLP